MSSSIVEHSLAARALAAAGDAIITVDTAGRITSWNEAARRLLGYSPQDAIGQTLALIIPPEHRPRHMAGFHAAIDSGRLAHSGAVARVEAATASGTRLALGLSLGLLPPEDGKPVGVVAVLRPLGEAVAEFVNALSQQRNGAAWTSPRCPTTSRPRSPAQRCYVSDHRCGSPSVGRRQRLGRCHERAGTNGFIEDRIAGSDQQP